MPVEQSMRRKVIFLTGTRADFGKVKPLIAELDADRSFDVHVVATGMHMLPKYGATWEEVKLFGRGELHTFVNQRDMDPHDIVLAKTITGFSDIVNFIKPDLIVVHGDRVEALAASCVGMFNSVLVAHIEGGEVSGTTDEIVRHAVTKISHIHFASNEDARKRLLQLGERPETVHVIGSPDIDVMDSDDLPTLQEARDRYGLPEKPFAIAMMHPWTQDRTEIVFEVAELTRWMIATNSMEFILIQPNNDPGSDIIRQRFDVCGEFGHIHVFPSIRFEYFLVLLRSAQFMIGNSSAGVREAPYYGVPTINIGPRQMNRAVSPTVINVDTLDQTILRNVALEACSILRRPHKKFGDGGSARRFGAIVRSNDFWNTSTAKQFVDAGI